MTRLAVTNIQQEGLQVQNRKPETWSSQQHQNTKKNRPSSVHLDEFFRERTNGLSSTNPIIPSSDLEREA